jgi:hypothetical protein
MRLVSVLKIHGIDPKEDYSSHIYVHKEIFKELVDISKPQSVIHIKLVNTAPQHVYCNVYASHIDEKDVIYAPEWILIALEHDINNVSMEPITPTKCSGIILAPHTHIEIDTLKNGFERYSCLRAGSTYKIWNPGGEKPYVLITVLETQPHSFEYLSILNCDINLELRKPLDSPIEKSHGFHVLNAPTAPPDWSLMKGHSLGGSVTSTLVSESDMRERRIMALSARLSKN